MHKCGTRSKRRLSAARMLLGAQVAGLFFANMITGCTVHSSADNKAKEFLAALDRRSTPPPEEFPEGIRTFPGLHVTDVMRVGFDIHLGACTDADADAVMNHYQNEFEKAGWSRFDLEGVSESTIAFRTPSGEDGATVSVGRMDAIPITVVTIVGPRGSDLH